MFRSDDDARADKCLHQWCVIHLGRSSSEIYISLSVVTAQDLWKTITSVSNAGAKRGRAKRRGATKFKDLNFGQRIGQGKSNVQWPGLNSPVAQGREIVSIMERPPDPMREERLLEVRNRLDRFRRLSIPPNERGFTGGSPAGKSLGVPEPINEGLQENLNWTTNAKSNL